MITSNSIIPAGKYIAQIDESRCVGCTLCIKACPFDAIIGASKLMHTVLTPYCTGCKLCLPPCPVDCIDLKSNTHFEVLCKNSPEDDIRELKKSFSLLARKNHRQRALRIKNIQNDKQALFELRKKELLQK